MGIIDFEKAEIDILKKTCLFFRQKSEFECASLTRM